MTFFQLLLFAFLSMGICFFKFCWIILLPSHFTETKIYVKLESKAGSAAHTLRFMLNLNLKLGTLHTALSSKVWCRLHKMESSIWKLLLKNQDENKNRNNESYEFTHYSPDLIKPSYIFHFSLSNTYISDPKREYR